MDIALFPGKNRQLWAHTMINLEARKLVNTANTVAAMHLSDSFTRLKSVDEIRQVVTTFFIQSFFTNDLQGDGIGCSSLLPGQPQNVLIGV
ncbi:hypothetical protein KKZ72_22095 [Enterobacter ludwigii]|nr:hypothetical protein [Enterobacter ludwigii]MBT1850643.1 hypothetical protein [Enterobacter ludwigii]